MISKDPLGKHRRLSIHLTARICRLVIGSESEAGRPALYPSDLRMRLRVLDDVVFDDVPERPTLTDLQYYESS